MLRGKERQKESTFLIPLFVPNTPSPPPPPPHILIKVQLSIYVVLKIFLAPPSSLRRVDELVCVPIAFVDR